MVKLLKRGEVPEQLRVPWGIWQALVVFALVWIGLPLVIILVARVLEPVLPFMTDFVNGLLNNNVDANFVESILDALAGLGLVWYYLRRYHVGWARVGWRRFSLWKAIGLLAIIFVVFLIGATVLLALVAWLVPSFNANQTQTTQFSGSVAQQHRLIATLALVVIPPIIEETVFRGFIFPAFAKRWGTWAGAISSSILFGFAHLQANVSIYTFLLGMLLCLMYVKLKSIYPGMALHMLNNYLALLAMTSK